MMNMRRDLAGWGTAALALVVYVGYVPGERSRSR